MGHVTSKNWPDPTVVRKNGYTAEEYDIDFIEPPGDEGARSEEAIFNGGTCMTFVNMYTLLSMMFIALGQTYLLSDCAIIGNILCTQKRCTVWKIKNYYT